MNSVEVYFGEYRMLSGDRLDNADEALQFLQKKIDRSENARLKFDFDTIWRDGKTAENPELLLKNVAEFYEPEKNPHQRKALNYLNDHLSEETREEFDRLWFGKPPGFRGNLI